MNYPTDNMIRQALDELADEPVPVGLADRAMASAVRRRRWRAGALVGVAALGVALAVPAIGYVTRGGGAAPVAAPLPKPVVHPAAQTPVACTVYSATDKSHRAVPPGGWPDFVSVVVSALPTRSDYVMQYGYGWCDNGTSDAYSVINLGLNREHGQLTLELYTHGLPTPKRCADVNHLAHPAGAAASTVLFCHEQTPTTPFVYGLEMNGVIQVGAAYADGRALRMESIPDVGQPAAITAEQLKAVVTDPQVHDVIPAAAASVPPGSDAGAPVPYPSATP